MIIIVKQNTPKEKISELIGSLQAQNFKTHLSEGESTTIIGLVGDTSVVDIDSLKARDIVEDVRRVSEPYKKVNRKCHTDDTISDVNGHKKMCIRDSPLAFFPLSSVSVGGPC